MRKIILIIVFLAASVASALAEQQVQMSSDDCKRLVKHVPAADVAFTPGVDVRGNKVQEADLEGRTPITLPQVFEFNITKDFSAYKGSTETPVGVIKYDVLSGGLTFNDQPLTNANEAELAATCQRLLQEGR